MSTELLNESAAPAVAEDRFGGHYRDWRSRRIAAIIARFGSEWFRGKRILELGCGYGDIGMALAQLGADVTFSDGREEHLAQIREWYPDLPTSRVVRYDAERPWPFTGRFDMVLHLGLLYHLDRWEDALASALTHADHVVLETEVCDSDDPELVVKTQESGYDQALSGVGSRPSGACIERFLEKHGAKHERVTDNRCNANIHRYDWPVRNTGTWEHGLRRFWYIDCAASPRLIGSSEFGETVDGWLSGPQSPLASLRGASAVAVRWQASGEITQLDVPKGHTTTVAVLIGACAIGEELVDAGAIRQFSDRAPVPITAAEHSLLLVLHH